MKTNKKEEKRREKREKREKKRTNINGKREEGSLGMCDCSFNPS